MIVENEKIRNEVLRSVPHHDSYDSQAGGRDDYLHVTAIFEDGSERNLAQAGTHEWAARSMPSITESADTVMKQIAFISAEKGMDAVGLRVSAGRSCSWEDFQEHLFSEKDFEKGLPVLSNGEEYEILVPLRPVDWAKVRRRAEDRIRKDTKAMKAVAGFLNIEIF